MRTKSDSLAMGTSERFRRTYETSSNGSDRDLAERDSRDLCVAELREGLC